MNYYNFDKDTPLIPGAETSGSNTIKLKSRDGMELSLATSIEAILFSASSPVSISQLASFFEREYEAIETALSELDQRYRLTAGGSGIALQRLHNQVQLTTSPQTAAVIERYLGLEATTRLSRAALETLAIIAYQEPVTRPHIDSIRGVNSDGVLKSLLSKGLIQEVGRAEAPGRPILYSITPEFLQQFGLTSLSELPSLDSNPTEDSFTSDIDELQTG